MGSATWSERGCIYSTTCVFPVLHPTICPLLLLFSCSDDDRKGFVWGERFHPANTYLSSSHICSVVSKQDGRRTAVKHLFCTSKRRNEDATGFLLFRFVAIKYYQDMT